MTDLRLASISTGAISRNVETLRALVAPAQVMAVVKADGYGHGAVASARAALDGGADWLGVADLAEAFALRDAGIVAPLLAWLHQPGAAFSAAVHAGIDLGISNIAQLGEVAAASGTACVHLKVDTGLHRNGAAVGDWQEFFEAAVAHELAGRIQVQGIWSHLANAGHVQDVTQIERFTAAIAMAESVGLRPEFRHLAASEGAIKHPDARFTLVRLGISIYGLAPADDVDASSLGLEPAMTLSAPVISVRRVAAGEGVSYGLDFSRDSDTTVALVPLGYADGIPRHASNRGPVSINGVTGRVAGRVAMDQIVVDMGDAAVAIGDQATLFGRTAESVPSADEWAAAAGTINYEIVTRLGHRVARRYES
ncbi:alanine racemase [Salinibacterium sp. M195]|uniref:alanine racemase n=1 Tax=Salinibacterium sp. M195 TaxID=2583374 RepID=UPI001C6366C0|nr:alanine racemase [Salinibacterium sp. M195]QYH35384.1 alanine racemase [Salinibacterium sp. M195]